MPEHTLHTLHVGSSAHRQGSSSISEVVWGYIREVRVLRAKFTYGLVETVSSKVSISEDFTFGSGE